MLEMKRGHEERVAALLLKVKALHWHAKKLCSKFCSSLLLGQITLPFWVLAAPFFCAGFLHWCVSKDGLCAAPGPAGAQCPWGRKSELPSSCPQQLPRAQTPKRQKIKGAEQQGKGLVGSSSPSSPPRQGEERREANLVVGTCEWEPLISAVNPLLHWVWIWLCFCGQDGPGMLGYVLGVSRGAMEPAVASMPAGTSCVLFWASLCCIFYPAVWAPREGLGVCTTTINTNQG